MKFSEAAWKAAELRRLTRAWEQASKAILKADKALAKARDLEGAMAPAYLEPRRK